MVADFIQAAFRVQAGAARLLLSSLRWASQPPQSSSQASHAIQPRSKGVQGLPHPRGVRGKSKEGKLTGEVVVGQATAEESLH